MRSVRRQEKKYLLDLVSSKQVEARVGAVMRADKHNHDAPFGNGYVVRSLYFDTIHDRDFADKLSGVDPRRKVRLRVYDPKADFALLELKQKQNIYQQKRSLPLTRAQALALMDGDYDVLLERDEEFAAEMHGIMSTYVYIPRAIVEYDRTAFAIPDARTRITFDRNIRATESNLNLFEEHLCLSPVLDPFNTVLEVKNNGVLLSYIKDACSTADKSELAVSKYCLARHVSEGYQF